MAMDACINEVCNASAGAVNREEAQGLLDLADQRAQRLADERGLSGPQAAQAAGRELADAEAMQATIARRNRLLNLQKRVARRQSIMEIARTVGGEGSPDLRHAVTNQIVARNAPARGNRLSAEAVWRARQAEYLGATAVALKRAGLLRAFRNGTIDDAWGRELFELSRQAAGDKDAKPGLTDNAEALKIAQIVHGQQELARGRLNSEGAWIGSYAGYITRTAHDAAKLRAAGFDRWRGFILPRLAAKTFEGVENREEFLRQTYSALSTGVHLADRDFVGMKDAAFTGPANLAARLSEGRKLHFADASGWLQYQRTFGNGTLGEQVMGAFDRAARQEALLRRWGTNPEAEFDNDLRWLAENERDAHPDAVRRLRDGEAGIRLRMDYLTRDANRPGNVTFAEIGAGLRAIESMAKLGGVAFTHLSAFTTKAAELRYHGVGWLEAYGNSLAALFRGRGQGETRELSDLLLAGVEGMHGSMLARFSADDAPAGTLSKLAKRFFSLSGLSYLLDAQKSGAARVMSRRFGMLLDTTFDKLPREAARTLQAYGITPGEWEALRAAPDHAQVDGRAHLTADAGMRADAAALGIGAGNLAPSDAQVARMRSALQLKLHTMFDDVAHRSVITPGIDERALFVGGTKPGTLAGEALRFIAQFKLWGAAAVRQGLGREVYGGNGAAGAISGIMHLALATAVFGYVTMTLKDLFKGQTPRNPLDQRTVLAAMMQGGGYGILGDYAFGQFNRFGQTPVEALAGPVAGSASELLQLLSLARGSLTGDPNARPKDAGPEALRLVQNNTPFLNLFYVRKALDYLLFHSLQEAMNPGYLRRAERSMKQRTGQSYILAPFNLSPQNHLHTFGH